MYQTIQLDLPEETKLQLQNIRKDLAEIKANFIPKEPKRYYTRNQLAELFNVNLSTIHNWCKRGIIQPLAIGSRVYFEREAVEKTLVKLKN